MSIKQHFRVGLVQMSATPDPNLNLQRAVAFTEEAAAMGAEVVCLPDLFRSKYFSQTEAPPSSNPPEPIPGPSTRSLGDAARKSKVVVIAPIFERRAPGLYHNSIAVISAGGEVDGLYRKMHIPDDPAYY